MPDFKKPKVIILTAIAIIAVIVILFYFLVIPRIINIEHYRPQIEQAVQERIDLPAELGKMKTSLTWDLGIRLYFDKIIIRHSDNRPFISTDEVFVEVALLPLRNKKVIIREIRINNAAAHITRLSSGKFDIEQLIPERKEKPKEYEVIFKNTNIIVNDYKLYFIDQYIQPNQKINIEGKSVRINDLDPDNFIRVVARGQILIPQKENTLFDITFSSKLPLNFDKILKSDLTLKGNVQNLYPERYLVYINKYTPYQFTDLSGEVDSRFDINLTENGFKPNRVFIEASLQDFFAKDNRGITFNFPGTTRINVQGNVNKNKIELQRAGVNSRTIAATLQGDIKNLRTQNPVLNLRLIIDKTRISSLVNLFPQRLDLPTRPLAKLQKYNVRGNLWTDIKIQGRAKSPDLFGHLRFNDFSMFVDSKKIAQSSGRIDFNGKTLAINTKTFINPKGFIKVTGTIAPVLEHLNLTVTSNEVDLRETQELLFAIRDIFNFPLGPVTQAAISGRGKLDLNINGKFHNVNLQGFVNIINAIITYKGFSKPVHDAAGFVRFQGNRVIYDNIVAFIEQSRIVANGYSTLQGFSNVKLTFPNLNLDTAEELVYNSPILAEVQRTLEDIKNISGLADAVIYLTGGPEGIAAKGNIIFKGATLSYQGISQPVRNLVGQLRFSQAGLFFDKLRGTIAQSPLVAEGTIINERVNVILTSSRLNISVIRQLIDNSPILSEVSQSIQELTALSGFADARLRLSGRLDEDVFQDLQLIIARASFEHAQLGFPVQLFSGRILLTTQNIFLSNLKGEILGAPAQIAGQITGLETQLQPNIELAVQNFQFERIRELVQAPIVPNDFRQLLEDFTELAGQFDANISILPQTYKARIDVDEVFAVYKPRDAPIELNSGNIVITPERIVFDPLYAIVSKSFIYLNGLVENYQTEPVLDLLTSARVNSEDIEEYLNPYLDEPIIAQGIIPVAALIKGQLDNWQILAQMTLGKGDNIAFQDISLPQDKIRVLSLRANGTQNRINIENLEAALGDSLLKTGLSASPLPEAATNLRRILTAKGSINNIQEETPVFENFYVATPNPVDVTLLNPAIETDQTEELFSRGEFTAEALLEGEVSSPEIVGNATLNEVVIPSRQTVIDFAQARFDQDKILLNDSLVNIADSQARVIAIAENDFETPFIINEIAVSSPSFNFDMVTEALRQPEDQEEEEKHETSPIIVEKGILVADELIISDLITTNFSSCFNLNEDWLVSMPNISFESTGGSATGELTYNIENSRLYMSLIAKDMQANAVATVLLSLPNEVYGTLEGKVELTTKGTTREELLANADGFAEFTITDGRLIRLGSLEYLLRAANVFQSGITGLTLSNIIDLIAPQETGYFNVLEGTLTALDGTLTTDNVNSEGENLNLSLTGELDMLTNIADITILGQVSKKVAGLLGPIGQLSIGTFLGIVPGSRFLDIIPGLSAIPFLGIGEQEKKYREFIVDIEGNLYDPNSVKNFQFLD